MKEQLSRIIEELERLNKLPIGEVKERIENLKMNISDLCHVTDKKITYNLSDREIQIINDERLLSYSEF